ncbi:hypothetical protein FAGAP_2769 [Fusarium agapanthi]|uniref:Uncharacterized protein n=1 Tax=Fusarium agapanthi TaxID=1803897 RepID=A0A9P5EFN2_9HYPO|nr:hypothetical protein FAGAP_2769 [Fusarium agapanthi]
MFCETFSDEGSRCEDLNLQCHSTSVPAGYFILHSFENIFAIHSKIWNAVGDAVRDNDIGTIASEFGKVPRKEGGLATSILIDIALMAWGIVMGPAWNKLIGPKFSDSTNAGTLKDTTNDLVKNSLTLTKDILNGRAYASPPHFITQLTIVPVKTNLEPRMVSPKAGRTASSLLKSGSLVVQKTATINWVP